MFRAYASLHFAIVIFGFTVILGRIITLPEYMLVWYRVGLATLGYLILIRPQKLNIPRRDMLQLGAVGGVLMLHWIAFFASIKYANASIGAVCLSTSILFAALLEPFFRKRRLKIYQVLLSLIVIVGIYLIHQFQEISWAGIIWGLISAFFSALYGFLNKKIIKKYDDNTVNLFELGFGFIAMTLLMPIYFVLEPHASFPIPTSGDWFYLIILAIVCTTFAYNLALNALRYIPTFNYVLAFNMEAIYGVILATFILGENKNVDWRSLLGASMVLGSVFFYPLLERSFTLRKRFKYIPSHE